MTALLRPWLRRARADHSLTGPSDASVLARMPEPGTFDTRFLRERFHIEGAPKSPWNELEYVPLAEGCPELRHVLETPKLDDTQYETLADYATALWGALLEYLESAIDPDRPTLVSHSAGFDSRIISTALVELRREGVDLSRLHFRSHEPENARFAQIMEAQGWPKHQWSTDAALPRVDHYDIARTDRPVSGWVPMTMQMNWWRDLVPFDEEKDWNILLGLGGGEMFDYPSRSFGAMRKMKHCENAVLNRWLNHCLYIIEWAGDLEARFHKAILPYFSVGWLGLAAHRQSRWLRTTERPGGGFMDVIRKTLLENYGHPRMLEIPYVGHDYHWNVSWGRWDDAATFWSNGKLARTLGADFTILNPFQKVKGRLRPNTHNNRLWTFGVGYEVFGA